MDMIEKLKSAKVVKQKKWLFNFAASVIKAHEEGRDYGFMNRKINVYYKQHYENYFSKTYRNMTEEEKGKYNKKQVKRDYNNHHGREMGRKYRAMFKLYKEGKLSEQSTEELDQVLDKITSSELL